MSQLDNHIRQLINQAGINAASASEQLAQTQKTTQDLQNQLAILNQQLQQELRAAKQNENIHTLFTLINSLRSQLITFQSVLDSWDGDPPPLLTKFVTQAQDLLLAVVPQMIEEFELEPKKTRKKKLTKPSVPRENRPNYGFIQIAQTFLSLLIESDMDYLPAEFPDSWYAGPGLLKDRVRAMELEFLYIYRAIKWDGESSPTPGPHAQAKVLKLREKFGEELVDILKRVEKVVINQSNKLNW